MTPVGALSAGRIAGPGVTRDSHHGLLAALVCAAVIGVGCSEQAKDTAKKDADAAVAATKAGADKAVDATKAAGEKTAEAAKDVAGKTATVAKDVAQKTADKTVEIAGKVADKSKEVASATGAAVTDGWITAKLKAKFADETVLKGSDISVDTTDHVVTLKGTVLSATAKTRAADIARGTNGVTRVVNQIVVK